MDTGVPKDFGGRMMIMIGLDDDYGAPATGMPWVPSHNTRGVPKDPASVVQ